MSLNKNAVMARVIKLSKDTKVDTNVILLNYFFDAVITRLAKSNYAGNFVFKGGFYLSSLFGLETRSTTDIDFKFQNETFNEETIIRIFNEVLQIDVDDQITFDFQSIKPIREEDQYGGFRISLLGHLDNIRQPVSIDIATGDPITPDAIEYKYKRLLQDDKINFFAYNLETVLSEKMETIYSRGISNSRSKDFYDVYIIYKLKWDFVKQNILKSAFQETCKYRDLSFTKEEVIDTLDLVEGNPNIKSRWSSYLKSKRYYYDISFSESIEICRKITEILFS